MTKQEIREQYNGKNLVTIPWAKESYLGVDVLSNEGEMIRCFHQVYGDYDYQFTLSGLNFLKEYYGFEHIADLVVAEAGPDGYYGSRDEIVRKLARDREANVLYPFHTLEERQLQHERASDDAQKFGLNESNAGELSKKFWKHKAEEYNKTVKSESGKLTYLLEE